MLLLVMILVSLPVVVPVLKKMVPLVVVDSAPSMVVF